MSGRNWENEYEETTKVLIGRTTVTPSRNVEPKKKETKKKRPKKKLRNRKSTMKFVLLTRIDIVNAKNSIVTNIINNNRPRESRERASDCGVSTACQKTETLTSAHQRDK